MTGIKMEGVLKGDLLPAENGSAGLDQLSNPGVPQERISQQFQSILEGYTLYKTLASRSSH